MNFNIFFNFEVFLKSNLIARTQEVYLQKKNLIFSHPRDPWGRVNSRVNSFTLPQSKWLLSPYSHCDFVIFFIYFSRYVGERNLNAQCSLYMYIYYFQQIQENIFKKVSQRHSFKAKSKVKNPKYLFFLRAPEEFGGLRSQKNLMSQNVQINVQAINSNILQ